MTNSFSSVPYKVGGNIRQSTYKGNSRHIPHQIPLTAREVYLKLGKNHADWNEDQLRQYFAECRKYGISMKEIGAVIHRSQTWVLKKCAELDVPKPPRRKKPTPVPRRTKPSKPRSI